MDDSANTDDEFFDHDRMVEALNSGGLTEIPQGLSQEEMRQFILNAGKNNGTQR